MLQPCAHTHIHIRTHTHTQCRGPLSSLGHICGAKNSPSLRSLSHTGPVRALPVGLPCTTHPPPPLFQRVGVGVLPPPAQLQMPSIVGVINTFSSVHGPWSSVRKGTRFFDLPVGLGNISILFRRRDARLDIVLDFGYRHIVIWHVFYAI